MSKKKRTTAPAHGYSGGPALPPCQNSLDFREPHRGPSQQHATDEAAAAFRGKCTRIEAPGRTVDTMPVMEEGQFEGFRWIRPPQPFLIADPGHVSFRDGGGRLWSSTDAGMRFTTGTLIPTRADPAQVDAAFAANWLARWNPPVPGQP